MLILCVCIVSKMFLCDKDKDSISSRDILSDHSIWLWCTLSPSRQSARFPHWMTSGAKMFIHVSVQRIRIASYCIARGAGRLTGSQLFQGSLCSPCIMNYDVIYLPRIVEVVSIAPVSHFLSVSYHNYQYVIMTSQRGLSQHRIVQGLTVHQYIDMCITLPVYICTVSRKMAVKSCPASIACQAMTFLCMLHWKENKQWDFGNFKGVT